MGLKGCRHGGSGVEFGIGWIGVGWEGPRGAIDEDEG